MKHLIDAIRFKRKRIKKKKWWRSDIQLIPVKGCTLRVLDTKGDAPALIIMPDGPNVIEHYIDLISKLEKDYRLIIFDMPGFGYSYHNGSYDYSFNRTSKLIKGLLDLLNIKKISISFPCANGFYGLAFAEMYPEYVSHLMLLQTPSLGEMAKWTKRIVPKVLKMPLVGQLAMPWMEEKFAVKWYDYALPKGKDRKPYSNVALKAVEEGGTFCLCSLTQGLLKEGSTHQFPIDDQVPIIMIYGNTDFTHKGTDFTSIKTYNERTEIIEFDKCGHFPDLEFPDRYIGVIREKIG